MLRRSTGPREGGAKTNTGKDGGKGGKYAKF